MTARYFIGDVFDALTTLDDASVDLVMTSPPFLALRSYLPADHPDKHREIGSEATPADFIDTLLDVTEACARVLAPHGSLVFELGDTYSGSGGAGGDYNEGGLREGQNAFDGSNRRAGGGTGWPLPKSLCMIPHLYAASLAYGRNLLRPERTIEPWRVRNVVAWCRPNPPVGYLADKYRPATSYLTVACKAKDRWFDLDAVRTEPAQHTMKYPRDLTPKTSDGRSGHDNGARTNPGQTHQYTDGHPVGAPPRDYWEISTSPYKGSHYATWPEKLCVRPILSMCPERVCTTCGEPSRRITERTPEYAEARERVGDMNTHKTGVNDRGTGLHGNSRNAQLGEITTAENVTVGWTDCGHDTWRRGVVLDPFAGSGTTLAVAEGHGRDSIGIDIDPRNADLARERVGMWLSVESPQLPIGGTR